MVEAAIIGGGPAGQAAALQLVRRGVQVTVFDEQARAGGQILRQPPKAMAVPSGDKSPTRALLRDFEALAVDFRGGRSVLGISPTAEGFTIDAAGPAGRELLTARHVLVAAGCQDVAVPLPGWTLPGVMAAGGLQAFVKAQQLIPGDRILLCGTHPLMLLIADQIVAGGGTVAGVMFAQTLAHCLRGLAAHSTAALRGSGQLLEGLAAFRRLKRAGIAVRFGQGLRALEGGRRVDAAVFADGSRVVCDTVGLCYGFVPQSELVRALGVRVVPAGPAGGWRALAAPDMQTNIQGLYAAGETIGVAGALAAAAGGAVAGIAIAASLGRITPAAAAREARPYRGALARHRRFAALLDAVADPTSVWPSPDDTTLICRCENVPLSAIAACLADVSSSDTVKLVTRCGMGLCQGRNCEPGLLRLMAQKGLADAGFAARYPARPVAIGDLLGDGLRPVQ